VGELEQLQVFVVSLDDRVNNGEFLAQKEEEGQEYSTGI